MFQQMLITALSTLPLGNACVKLQHHLGGTPGWHMGFWLNGGHGPDVSGIPTMDVSDDADNPYGTVTDKGGVLTWTSAKGEILEGVEDISQAITDCLVRHMDRVIAESNTEQEAQDNREWAVEIGLTKGP